MLKKSFAILEALADKHDTALVGYSGGKDSMVVLDLAVRVFKKVKAFNMEFVPDMTIWDIPLLEAEARYGIEIKRYPHWATARALIAGAYCDKRSDVPDIGLDGCYEMAMHDAGVPFVITGARSADSPTRRRFIGAHKGKKDHVVYPIVEWHKYDVAGYLKLRNLPMPDSSGASATGVDLSTRSLCWLYDRHPRDFEKLEEYFPYAKAAILREEWFGRSA